MFTQQTEEVPNTNFINYDPMRWWLNVENLDKKEHTYNVEFYGSDDFEKRTCTPKIVTPATPTTPAVYASPYLTQTMTSDTDGTVSESRQLTGYELFDDTYKDQSTGADTNRNILGDYVLIKDPNDTARKKLAICGQVRKRGYRNAQAEHKITFENNNLGTIENPVITCDCSFLQWGAPAATAFAATVEATQSLTIEQVDIPVPQSDTSARATEETFDKCYDDGGTCATTGAYQAANIQVVDSTNTAVDITTLTWITFNEDSQTFTVNPTVAEIGTYTIKATYTPTHGTSSAHDIVSLTVDPRCQTTSFTRQADPAPIDVYTDSTAATLDLSAFWVPSPDCGYIYTALYESDDIITQMSLDANTGLLTMTTDDQSLNGNTV